MGKREIQRIGEINMNPLLISGYGTSINVDSRKLIINNKLKNEKLEFYPHKINHDNIIIDGHHGYVSFEALRWLSKHNIPLTLLDWNGKLLSITLPDTPKSGKLRILQYQKYLNNDFRFNIATEIINIKFKNSLNLLKQLSQFYDVLNIINFKKTIYKEEFYYKQALNDFKTHKNSLKLLKNLMTFEGRIATIYWSELYKIFKILKPDFNFKSRKHKESSRNYNASDEINALLNYGYSILESEIRKSINSVGLDPSIGFLHEITQSRTPLVYDIQELFRWIIDLSVIQLLEENNINKSDFIITENYHTKLKEDTARLLIEKIKSNFNTKVKFKQNKKYYYQNILTEIVQNLSAYILSKKKDLDISIPELILSRNDSTDIKKKILNMTPEQRKNLGINKSTLWYIKNNIKSGKSLKIYNKILTKLV